MYEQPVIPVADPQTFSAVKAAIESVLLFQPGGGLLEVAGTRRSCASATSRWFSRKGLLGAATAAEYSRLGNGDQGQIRELYLASLEQVAPELREKFFKLYAYY